MHRGDTSVMQTCLKTLFGNSALEKDHNKNPFKIFKRKKKIFCSIAVLWRDILYYPEYIADLCLQGILTISKPRRSVCNANLIILAVSDYIVRGNYMVRNWCSIVFIAATFSLF